MAIGSMGGIGSLDPSLATQGSGHSILAPAFDTPLWMDANGQVMPGMVSTWTVSNDGLTWTLQLRSDMKFQDGSPATAEDVAFSLTRMIRPGVSTSATPVWRSQLSSVAALSPTSLRVVTRQPWVELITQMMEKQGPEAMVVSKAQVQTLGDQAFSKPLGSGPWRVTSFSPSQRIGYEAITWDHPVRGRPAFGSLEILEIPEESTRAAMLRTGAADIVEVGPDAFTVLRRAGFTMLSIRGGIQAGYVNWGTNDPRIKGNPLEDKRVREAMALAVNRQELAQTLFSGNAAVLPRHQIIPGSEGYDPSWQPIPFDVSRAKQLLSESGFSRGFEVTLYSYPDIGAPWLPRIVEAVAGYWSPLGINAKIVPLDASLIRVWYRENPKNIGLVGTISGQRIPPTYGHLSNFSAQAAPGLVDWFPRTPQIDDLLKRANMAFDINERVQLLRQIQEFAHQWYGMVPLLLVDQLFGASAKVGSWASPPGVFVGVALDSVRPRR